MKKALLVGSFLICATAFQEAVACSHRGELSEAYCDENRDLVADTPSNTVNPSSLMMAVSAVENTNVAFQIYHPLAKYLTSCLKREVILFPPAGTGTVMEGMRKGIIHIAQFHTGNTMIAVNHTGSVPFASKGFSKTGQRKNYRLQLIVKSNSAFKKPMDLKGRRVAHSTKTSNSGDQAPRALFPDLGLTPDADYTVVYTGKHEASLAAIKTGTVDAAAVASDIFERELVKGTLRREDFRVIFESSDFPTESFAMSHALAPKLAQEIRQCFFAFQFPPSMSDRLEGTDRFYPTSYNTDWMLVRMMAKVAGTKLDEVAYRNALAGK